MARPPDLLKTDSPEIWASEFMRIKREKGWTSDDIDFGLMWGWFTRAMAVRGLMREKGKNVSR